MSEAPPPKLDEVDVRGSAAGVRGAGSAVLEELEAPVGDGNEGASIDGLHREVPR